MQIFHTPTHAQPRSHTQTPTSHTRPHAYVFTHTIPLFVSQGKYHFFAANNGGSETKGKANLAPDHLNENAVKAGKHSGISDKARLSDKAVSTVLREAKPSKPTTPTPNHQLKARGKRSSASADLSNGLRALTDTDPNGRNENRRQGSGKRATWIAICEHFFEPGAVISPHSASDPPMTTHEYSPHTDTLANPTTPPGVSTTPGT